WDFERDDHEAGALRLWRLRVLLAGQGPFGVELRHELLAGGAREILSAAGHVHHLIGEEPLSGSSWAPLGTDTFVAEHPRVGLGIDVTRLGPGEHVLSPSVDGAAPMEPLRFRIARRPIYAYSDRAPGRPAAHASGGLRPLDQAIEGAARARFSVSHVFR